MRTLLLLVLCLTAAAQDENALMLHTDVPVLINGQVADRKDYPATIWIGNCTASLVGPRSVYTAAHCVGSRIAFSVGTERFTAQCMSAPEYRSNTTADYALCYTDREVTGVPFENVNTDPAHIKEGDWVWQSGFGCTRWGQRLDGQLRVGRAQVLTMPRGTSNDYVTGNGAVLCSGDSGGPAWSLDVNGERDRLISVNSRSNTTSRSYLSAIATPTGIRFTESYIARFRTPICGISPDAPSCRKAKPKQPEQFTLASSQVRLVVEWRPTAKYSVDEAKKALQMALDALDK